MLVSASVAGTAGDSGSTEARISSDEGRVVFSSFAQNLGPASGGFHDTFLERFDTGAVTLLSAAPAGFANPSSQRPAIGSDGTLACFDSAASNLVSVSDANGTVDVFCSTLP